MNITNNKWCKPLPTSMKVWDDRRLPIIEACRGKRVAHVGCCDAGRPENPISLLHNEIRKVATAIIGYDNDESCLEEMAFAGYKVRYYEAEDSASDIAAEISSGDYDILIVPELIEHLSDLTHLFYQIKMAGLPTIITTPNAFSWRIIKFINNNVECVHDDHVHYFSYHTLMAACKRHGLTVDKVELYNYVIPDDPEVIKLLETKPFFAEGLIFYLNGGNGG